MVEHDDDDDEHDDVDVGDDRDDDGNAFEVREGVPKEIEQQICDNIKWIRCFEFSFLAVFSFLIQLLHHVGQVFYHMKWIIVYSSPSSGCFYHL